MSSIFSFLLSFLDLIFTNPFTVLFIYVLFLSLLILTLFYLLTGDFK